MCVTRDGGQAMRKLGFTDAARFNFEMDTNAQLKAGIAELDRRFTELTEREYRARMLELFSEAGVEITDKELEMLLLLRMKTDQLLLKKTLK